MQNSLATAHNCDLSTAECLRHIYLVPQKAFVQLTLMRILRSNAEKALHRSQGSAPLDLGLSRVFNEVNSLCPKDSLAEQNPNAKASLQYSLASSKLGRNTVFLH